VRGADRQRSPRQLKAEVGADGKSALSGLEFPDAFAGSLKFLTAATHRLAGLLFFLAE
jgi:hypothetical protein